MPIKSIQILLVDNMSTNQQFVKTLLNDLGYTKLSGADNKDHAIDIIKDINFDLIVSDWKDKDLMVHLRNDVRHKNIHVIIISSEAKREEILEAAELGVSGYLIIPLSKGILQNKIETIFKDKVK